jgi:geranyl-CoA carboxylase beta subunit
MAATGEVATDADLGGAEMHAEVTGLVDYPVGDDVEALEIAREVIAGLVPLDYRTPYDMRELAARLVDGSELRDFKAGYRPATVCLHGAVHGIPVGLIGNNGPIDTDGATKATHFLQLLDQAGTPVIFLNNTTGFMVGIGFERADMIKHGAKMIQAVTNMRVPKISVDVGASFVAGNYGMCGYAFDPDFLFTWPSAMTGVMGGAQAATTMEEVACRSAERKGIAVDEEQLAAQTATITRHFDQQSNAFFTSGRMLDHGMIDPRDTRQVIAFCLQTCAEAKAREGNLRPNTFGVARP